MKTRRTVATFLAMVAFGATGTIAGPYTDDLAKCLVESTTDSDRAGLVRWMFAALSRHPDVRSLAAVTDEQLDQANAQVAGLFTRLITRDCRETTIKAMRYEGADTIGNSFKVLGEVAAMGLMGHSEVQGAIAGLQEHVDADAWNEVLQGQ